MPRMIEYPEVLRQMTAQGMICNYPSSGAFSFPTNAPVTFAGWIGPPDPTIRPEARAMAVEVAAPCEETLSRHAVAFWTSRLPGDAWLMPMSHWAYELQHEASDWLPDQLRQFGLSPEELSGRTTASALVFAVTEATLLQAMLRLTLENAAGSDFMLAFPGRPALCMVHHHKQLWWMFDDAELAANARDAAVS